MICQEFQCSRRYFCMRQEIKCVDKNQFKPWPDTKEDYSWIDNFIKRYKKQPPGNQ